MGCVIGASGKCCDDLSEASRLALCMRLVRGRVCPDGPRRRGAQLRVRHDEFVRSGLNRRWQRADNLFSPIVGSCVVPPRPLLQRSSSESAADLGLSPDTFILTALQYSHCRACPDALCWLSGVHNRQ